MRRRVVLATFAFTLAFSTAGSITAQAADERLENLSFSVAGLGYKARVVEFRGTSLSRAQLASIFDVGAAEPIAARLGRLDAAEIVIPELVSTTAFAGQNQVTTYRDVVLRDVKNGRAATARGAGGTSEFEIKPGGPLRTSTIGPISIEGFDLLATARVFTEKRSGPAEPALVLYRNVTISDVRVPASEDQPAVSIARMTGSDLAIRLGSEPLIGLMNKMTALAPVAGAKAGPASKQAENEVLLLSLELLDALEAANFEMVGMTIADPPGKPKSGSGTVARIGMTRPASGDSSFRVEGMDITSPDGRVAIAGISAAGFSLKPTLEALREWLSRPEATRGDPDVAKLVPQLGTIRLEGLQADLKDKAGKVGVKLFELALSNPVGAVPTKVRLLVDGLSAPLDAKGAKDGLKDLIAMGYKSLELSGAIEGAWNKAASEFAIDRIEFGGPDLLQAKAGATIGNVTEDSFAADLALSQVAWLGATVKKMDITVTNRGFFDRFLANEAKKAGKSAEGLRREYGTMAALALPALLGDSAGAKAVSAAVARFVAKPGTLRIEAAARTPAGLGLADVVTVSDPKEIFEKIDLKATAE